ncbi:uncharacterized protein LOC128218049 isoform X1 [Mya arenaria]|uniref:uncharacterized protein LOC128218049 isoform X1 n=1 Tax=Mya arenaria TaxID=6604 RepID=UPI0022E963F7|nr:uncharacterized protein LOC128218049 isoform X1 [Mya arenaria]
MDKSKGVTGGAPGNTTDTEVLVAEERVEAMSIIVWSVGALLLLALLSLLARIVLARRKQEFDDACDYDYYGDPVPRNTESRPALRLFIDGQGYVVEPGSPSRDTASLVPATDNTVAGSPEWRQNAPPYSAQNDTNARQINETSTPNRSRQNSASNSIQRSTQSLPNNSEILTRHLRVGEYVNSLPSPVPSQQTAEILPDDFTGCHATINGYVISPPSYYDVVNSSSPEIPSVIVDRPATRPQPRRILFSL